MSDAYWFIVLICWISEMCISIDKLDTQENRVLIREEAKLQEQQTIFFVDYFIQFSTTICGPHADKHQLADVQRNIV